jgi:hypothetical protein
VDALVAAVRELLEPRVVVRSMVVPRSTPHPGEREGTG